GDAGAGRFCDGVPAPPPTLCDDFDDPLDASTGARWDTVTGTDTGTTVTLDTMLFESKPRSLHAQSATVNHAGVERAFAGVTAAFSIAFDFRVHDLPKS